MWKKIILIVICICAFLGLDESYGYIHFKYKGSGITAVDTADEVFPFFLEGSSVFKSDHYWTADDYKTILKQCNDVGTGVKSNCYNVELYGDPSDPIIGSAWAKIKNVDQQYWTNIYAMEIYYNILFEVNQRLDMGYNDKQDLLLYNWITFPYDATADKIDGVLGNFDTDSRLHNPDMSIVDDLNKVLPIQDEFSTAASWNDIDPLIWIGLHFDGTNRLGFYGALVTRIEYAVFGTDSVVEANATTGGPNPAIWNTWKELREYRKQVRNKLTNAKPYEPKDISLTPYDGSISENEEGAGYTTSVDTSSAFGDNINSWWKAAKEFFARGQAKSSSSGFLSKVAKALGLKTTTGGATALVENLTNMIFTIGNMIFIVVTSILGVKYIFGAAEGKAQVKDSLVTLVVAAVFFYGWTAITNMLDIINLFQVDTYETAAKKIYNTILFIVNFLAISGIIWLGVKYMISSSEGKADIKTNWIPVILGIVMVYATVWFLSTVVQVVL